eukprot:gene9900-biopygen16757
MFHKLAGRKAPGRPAHRRAAVTCGCRRGTRVKGGWAGLARPLQGATRRQQSPASGAQQQMSIWENTSSPTDSRKNAWVPNGVPCGKSLGKSLSKLLFAQYCFCRRVGLECGRRWSSSDVSFDLGDSTVNEHIALWAQDPPSQHHGEFLAELVQSWCRAGGRPGGQCKERTEFYLPENLKGVVGSQCELHGAWLWGRGTGRGLVEQTLGNVGFLAVFPPSLATFPQTVQGP